MTLLHRLQTGDRADLRTRAIVRIAVGVVGYPVAVAIVVERVRDAVTVQVRRRAARVVRVGAELFLVDVVDAVAVAVGVAVIADSVAVQVGPLGRVVGEDVVAIVEAIAVTIVVQRVGNTVAVEVWRQAGRIVRVEAELGLEVVADAVAVAVRIAVVADTVAVDVRAFARIVRERIRIVVYAITVAIVIERVRNAVAVQVGRRAVRVVGSKCLGFVVVADAVAVAVGIGVVTDAVTVDVR